MTAIERTAYPRLKRSHYRHKDLQLYLPSNIEIAFMRSKGITEPKLQVSFLLLLKTYQRLGYFIKLTTIPDAIVKQVLLALEIDARQFTVRDYRNKATSARHRNHIREFLDVLPFEQSTELIIEKVALQSAQTMNDPADIINAALEELINLRFELPSFFRLDAIVLRCRNQVNRELFKNTYDGLVTADKIKLFREVLLRSPDEPITPYQYIKEQARKVSISNFRALIKHHEWLMEFGDMQPFINDISKVKLAQFAEEARSKDAAHMKAMHNQHKQFSLMACLLYTAQCQAKDDLVTSLIKVIKGADKAAQRDYHKMIEEKDELPLGIAELLSKITGFYESSRDTPEKLAILMQEQYQAFGGIGKVQSDCGKVIAKHSRKHMPLIWQYFKNKRATVLKFLNTVVLGARAIVKTGVQGFHKAMT